MTSGPGNLVFYVSGITLVLLATAKLPALARRRHDMRLRAACLLLFAGGCSMLLAAPESIVEFNRLTGIPNLAAPVFAATMTAFSGASLLLIINWRPAPPQQTLRASRLCVAVYSLTILAIFLLYWAGSAPVEQVALFDVYYANTAYVREMIVTSLATQGVAMMAASALCWRWSRRFTGRFGQACASSLPPICSSWATMSSDWWRWPPDGTATTWTSSSTRCPPSWSLPPSSSAPSGSLSRSPVPV